MNIPVRNSRPALWAILALSTSVLLWPPAPAAAQDPVRTFDQLGTRLKVGDTVWVTDASGREVKGRIEGLGSTSLTLSGGKQRTFNDSDVRAIMERPQDSLKFGALLGLGIGLGVGVALVAVSDETDGAAVGIAMLGGIGAGIGCGIDAMIPMPRRPVYLPQGGTPKGQVSLSPIVGPRAAGAAVSFAF
jgi:hypothetical protein